MFLWTFYVFGSCFQILFYFILYLRCNQQWHCLEEGCSTPMLGVWACTYPVFVTEWCLHTENVTLTPLSLLTNCACPSTICAMDDSTLVTRPWHWAAFLQATINMQSALHTFIPIVSQEGIKCRTTAKYESRPETMESNVWKRLACCGCLLTANKVDFFLFLF